MILPSLRSFYRFYQLPIDNYRLPIPTRSVNGREILRQSLRWVDRKTIES